jgi:aerobic C4-dicarboxylate transport protein
MSELTGVTHIPAVADEAKSRKKPWYTSLSWQVLIAIGIAIVFGVVNPALAAKMKPLGDGFIRLITMIIAIVVFCTVVSGIAGMEDMKKVGRVGGKALLYFEIVSTIALVLGCRAEIIELAVILRHGIAPRRVCRTLS